MDPNRYSKCFDKNLFFWKIFGSWSGFKPNKYYKYYSFIYLNLSLFVYNILLTINLIYTPRKVELLIREVIFYFTLLVVAFKVMMILKKRTQIIEALALFDCKEFRGRDEVGREMINRNIKYYNRYWRVINVISYTSYYFQILAPVIIHFIWNTNLELPISQYYFLSDDARDKFFSICFIYQSTCIYEHMMYNVTFDTFIAGIMTMAITQMKILNHDFSALKLEKTTRNTYNESREFKNKLILLINHHNLILRYCDTIQELFSFTMFAMFCLASCIICVVMCGFMMVSSSESLVFLVTYMFVMIMQIFVPAWLGTQLTHESQKLAFAAYSTDWIPQTESYKRNLRLFVERLQKPVVITGFKIFPLSLGTFISIAKMAYSFFTLVRKVQDHEHLNHQRQ